MNAQPTSVIKTQCGRRFDLSRAFPVVRNIAAPFGIHNFAVYKANGTYYVKGYNTGTSEQALDAFELISEKEAFWYLNH